MAKNEKDGLDEIQTGDAPVAGADQATDVVAEAQPQGDPTIFKAPEHTSQVFGPHSIFTADEQGNIEVPANVSDADRDALRRAGCVPVASA